MKSVSNVLLRSLLFTFVLLSFISAQTANNSTKSVLVVYGGWDGHKPGEFKDLFVPWLKDQGFEVVVSNSLNIYGWRAICSTSRWKN